MIRIGIIGAGPNAQSHAQYFAQSPRCNVVMIADPDEQRATALADAVQATPIDDFRAMLGHVDAVVISSPNFLHRDHAIDCAEAGKHVYIEKPPGLTLHESQQIAGAVAAAGVASVVGFSVRFDGTIQTMQRIAGIGELGAIVSICSRRLMFIDPNTATGWRRDHRLSGGLLLEINIHELDWMLALGGPVHSVYARTWTSNSNGGRSNDHVWVTLNFERGAVGLHEGSWLSAQPQFYRSVQGTLGGLCTNEWGNELYWAANSEGRTSLQPDAAFDLRGHFLDCIEGKAAPVADAAWGVRVMEVVEAILESAASGEVVRLDRMVAAQGVVK